MIYYTDGSASNNKTQCGGWAVIKVEENGLGNCIEIGSDINTTNNRMELIGVLHALRYSNSRKFDEEDDVIYTDSAYIANCFKDRWYVKWEQNGWINSKKEAVKNQDLWEKILIEYRKNIHRVSICKVKGHADNKYNHMADRMAVTARTDREKRENGN